MIATLQIPWQWAREKDELNMDSNSWGAKGPIGLRKDGGILSGPAVPLHFIILMVDNNLSIWSGAQLSLLTDDHWVVFWIDSWDFDQFVTC